MHALRSLHPTRAKRLSIRSAPRRTCAAFTLVEVLFALILVSVALLALEGTTARTIRRIADSHRESLAANLAQQQIGRLVASRCISGTGADSINQVTVRWSSRVTTSSPPTTTIVQDIQYPIATGMHRELLNTIIPCR